MAPIMMFYCIIGAPLFQTNIPKMLSPQKNNTNQPLIGRVSEQAELKRIGSLNESAILVVYGRRRVGKTSLIETVYANRSLIKIEGAEGASPDRQLSLAKLQLESYIKEASFKHASFSTWLELFQFLANHLATGKWTLYFEELQWLTGEDSSFISEFKIAWDNRFRHNPELLVVLCGSSPSFMIQNVLRSKALYNRSQHELHLKPFSLQETHKFIGEKYSHEQALDAHLLVGGIPEYLKYLRQDPSVLLSICRNSFKSDAFFKNEYEKVFTSSLANNPNYKQIIEILAQSKSLSRTELLANLELKSGGGISKVLDDLLLCGFVDRIAPFHLNPAGKSTKFRIADAYLCFYHKFIQPILNDIQEGRFNESPLTAIDRSGVDQYLAYAFERYCQINHRVIASILGFSGIKYRSGAYFERGSKKPDVKRTVGYQWDLVFDRSDKVLTLCEVKYSRAPVGTRIIQEFEERLEKLPIKSQKTVQRVLISVNGASEELINACYFDRIIRIEEIFV